MPPSDLPDPGADTSGGAVFHSAVYLRTVGRLRAAGCVFAEDEAALLIEAAATPGHLETMVSQRVSGLPLEPILGWAEFYGLRIEVDAGVFVPRRRTEFLVTESSRLLEAGDIVLDLCCGSGAVGAALAQAVPGIRLYLADVDATATACAQRNVRTVGGQVFTGDLFESLPVGLAGQLRLVVVNAPYVPTDAIALMPPEARLYEPRVSLDGGADGLDIHRRIAADVAEWITPDGYLLIETSVGQSDSTAEIVARAGFDARIAHSDDLDATIVIAHKNS